MFSSRGVACNRFSLKMDVASALAVGQYDIAMWNLVLVLSWAGRLDVRSFVDLHYRDAHVSTCVLPVGLPRTSCFHVYKPFTRHGLMRCRSWHRAVQRWRA